jgi:hypothetical protein
MMACDCEQYPVISWLYGFFLVVLVKGPLFFFFNVTSLGWGTLIGNKRYLSESRLNEPLQCCEGRRKLPLSKNGNASEL